MRLNLTFDCFSDTTSRSLWRAAPYWRPDCKRRHVTKSPPLPIPSTPHFVPPGPEIPSFYDSVLVEIPRQYQHSQVSTIYLHKNPSYVGKCVHGPMNNYGITMSSQRARASPIGRVRRASSREVNRNSEAIFLRSLAPSFRRKRADIISMSLMLVLGVRFVK